MEEKRVFDYALGRELGAGALGSVCTAAKENLSGAYECAIKRIDFPPKSGVCEGLTDEDIASCKADLLSYVSDISGRAPEYSSDHVAICRDNDSAIDEAGIQIYLRYDLCAQVKAHDAKNVARMANDVLSGLHAFHSVGRMHRNISLNNILRAKDGRFMIMDALPDGKLGDALLKRKCRVAPLSVAPEVYMGEKYAPNADIYALGAVMQQLLLDTPEEEGELNTLRALVRRHSGELPKLPDNLPDDLRTIVNRALSPEVKRYATAADMRSDISKFIDDQPLMKPAPQPKVNVISEPQPQPVVMPPIAAPSAPEVVLPYSVKKRKHTTRNWLLTLVFIASIALGVFFAMGSDSSVVVNRTIAAVSQMGTEISQFATGKSAINPDNVKTAFNNIKDMAQGNIAVTIPPTTVDSTYRQRTQDDDAAAADDTGLPSGLPPVTRQRTATSP